MITSVANLRYGATYDVYCGRAMPDRNLPESPWANPFRIGSDGDRDEVIRKHRVWLFEHPQLAARVKEELYGKILGCWCAPQRCHCDTYVELAEAHEILISGGREWVNDTIIRKALARVPAGTIIIHGGQRGADTVADRVAKELGFDTIAFPAWGAGADQRLARSGKGAGNLRNLRMLLRSPKRVLAFHDDLENQSRGTKHCVTAAQFAGITVELFTSTGAEILLTPFSREESLNALASTQ